MNFTKFIEPLLMRGLFLYTTVGRAPVILQELEKRNPGGEVQIYCVSFSPYDPHPKTKRYTSNQKGGVSVAKVSEIKKDKDVQKKINQEMKRLNLLFEKIPKEKKGVVQSLIDSASFQTVILSALEKHIAEHGTTSEYQNGANQWGTKRSPEVEVYNSMIKNQMGIIRQLTDLIEKTAGEEDDGFDSFLQKRYQ